MTCLDEVQRAIADTPPLPAATQRALQVVADPQASTDELLALVRDEPELAAKVLELSNSSIHEVPREICDASQTVAYLGSSMLARMVIAHCTSACFSRPEGPQYDPGEVWRHGIATGLAAELLAEAKGAATPALAFAAGILHNLGKPLLAPYVAAQSGELEAIAEGHRCPFPKAERVVLGIDHAAAGALLAERWHLPAALWQTIRYHHHPDFSPHTDELTALVHVADLLALQLGIGLGLEGLTVPVCPEALRRLHLHLDDLDQVRVLLLQELSRAEDLLKLVPATGR